MRNVCKIFVQLCFSDSQLASVSLNDDSYERQPGRTAGVCAPLYEGNNSVSVVTFGPAAGAYHSLTGRFTGLRLAYKHRVV